MLEPGIRQQVHKRVGGVFAFTTRLYTRSFFLKNTLFLVSGSVISQVLLFLASPVLTRIFELSDFGNFANFNAWVSLLAILSSLRFEHAIFLTRTRFDLYKVLAITLVLSVISFAVFAALCAALYYSGTAATYLVSIRPILPWIPVGVISLCITSVFNQVAIKRGHFKLASTNAFSVVAVTIAIQLSLGFIGIDNAMIIGAIAGNVAGAAILVTHYFRGHYFKHLAAEFNLTGLFATYNRYIQFPKFALGADMINAVVQQFVPVFMLAVFNPAVAGIYSFSVRVIRIPVILISVAFMNVLRNKASDYIGNKEQLSLLYRKTLKNQGLLSLLPFLALLFYGDYFFVVFFGTQWEEAGVVAQILTPGIWLEFLAIPLTVFLVVTGRQKYNFLTQVTVFLAILASVAAGRYYFDDFRLTCYLITGALVLANLFLVYIAYRQIGSRKANPGIIS